MSCGFHAVKTKVDKVSRQERIYSSLLPIWKGDKLSELNPPEIKGRRVFKCWGEQETIGQLCLLTDITQRKNKLSCIFVTESSFIIQIKVITEVRLLLFQRNWKIVSVLTGK